MAKDKIKRVGRPVVSPALRKDKKIQIWFYFSIAEIESKGMENISRVLSDGKKKIKAKLALL